MSGVIPCASSPRFCCLLCHFGDGYWHATRIRANGWHARSFGGMTYTPGSQLTAMDPNAAMIGASSSVVVHVQEVSGSPLDVPVKVKLVSRNQMSEQDQARALDIGNLGRDDYRAEN